MLVRSVEDRPGERREWRCILSWVADVIPYVPVVKRSPILGYNHNVRYRGLVFHVQTEDSGVQSPHVFTHLFHGGVILSTRKLVYDAGASEDVIRSLMQAQHKATLKELRRGQYDDKIDEYLGADPGLLPRGSSDDEEEDLRESSVKISADTPESRAVTRDPAIHPTPVSIPVPVPPKSGPLPAALRESEESRPVPARVPTSENGRLASMGAASLPPLPSPPQPGRGGTTPRFSAAAPPRPAITPPVVVARDHNERSDSSEIYSPPPPSADPPPGLGADHPGAYSVRRRDGSVEPAAPPRDTSRGVPAPAPQRPSGPISAPAGAGVPAGAAGGVGSGATARPSAPRTPIPATPAPLSPRNRQSGGVVMSRPAVIVGAPRTNPAPLKRPVTEEERRGFGQGLISEKSLDEVILAYLSEDANDE